VEPSDAGVASAAVTACQQVGGSVGVALLSTLAASAVTSYLSAQRPSAVLIAHAAAHGYTTGFAWAAGMFALGAVIGAALFTGRSRASQPSAQAVLAH
jgi:hypothetical protein